MVFFFLAEIQLLLFSVILIGISGIFAFSLMEFSVKVNAFNAPMESG
ncbi:hypothetical protein M5D96_013306 [Drosophila gunungcola]|uniref:Uncharacterized protein n=1 Tax=Drosophila gunungcola TaxID=103775 RepID=A0A9Q0BIN3_9MUSC|nr:hypothetical protein M5D96_013306 [Drosophila gunungcola]